MSLGDARAWYLGLGLSATEGAKARAVPVLVGRSSYKNDEEGTDGDVDQVTTRLHAHCMADSASGLVAHLNGLFRRVGPMATGLLINRPLYVPLPTGATMEVTAMTCVAMWERDPAKLRILVSYGGRVDLPDAGGLYLEERLPLLPYANHLALYSGRSWSWRADGTGRESRVAGRRPADCEAMCGELRRLAGEEPAPRGWCRPTPARAQTILFQGVGEK